MYFADRFLPACYAFLGAGIPCMSYTVQRSQKILKETNYWNELGLLLGGRQVHLYLTGVEMSGNYKKDSIDGGEEVGPWWPEKSAETCGSQPPCVRVSTAIDFLRGCGHGKEQRASQRKKTTPFFPCEVGDFAQRGNTIFPMIARAIIETAPIVSAHISSSWYCSFGTILGTVVAAPVRRRTKPAARRVTDDPLPPPPRTPNSSQGLNMPVECWRGTAADFFLQP